MSAKNKKIQNKKALAFLAAMPQNSIDDSEDKLTERCKFNFHYLSFNSPAAPISGNGDELLDHLKVFSEHPLSYWEKLRHPASKYGHYLEYYGAFPMPPKTEYTYPPGVPADVRWARFVISGRKRLIGFVVPEEKHGICHHKTGSQFDKNTFYCVFIDLEHRFWLVN